MSVVIPRVGMDAITTDAITTQARAVKFWPTVLNLAAFLLLSVGKLAYYTLRYAWLAAVWVFVAVRQGWREARAADLAKQHEALMRRRNGE